MLGHPVLASTRLLDTLEASDALVDSETQVLLQPRRGRTDKLNLRQRVVHCLLDEAFVTKFKEFKTILFFLQIIIQ